MGLSSQTLADTRVYAQDTQPTDERDGIIWVDTSVSPRDTFVYSAASNSWENIAPSNVYQQNEPPTNPAPGDIWVDTDNWQKAAFVWDDTYGSTGNWRRITQNTDDEIHTAMAGQVTQNTASAGGYTTVGGTLSDGDTTTTTVTNNSYTNVQISGLVCNGVRVHLVDDTGIPDLKVTFIDGTTTDLGNLGLGWNNKSHESGEVDYYRVGDSDNNNSYPVEYSEVQPHETPVGQHSHTI